MRFRWPVKCNALLNVLKKMMQRYNWKELPTIWHIVHEDSCGYNVFCSLICHYFRMPRKADDFLICIKCGSHSATKYMNQAISLYATCKRCFFDQRQWLRPVRRFDILLHSGYILRYELGAYCNDKITREMRERKLHISLLKWWDWTRHFRTANFWELCPSLYEYGGKKVVSKRMVDDLLEMDLLEYTKAMN